MSNSIVREALVTSVAWRPVSLNTSQESIVPKHAPRRGVDVFEQPLDLRRGEIRVEDEAGALAHEILVAPLAQVVAACGGTAVLPDKRVVDGLAARAVPGDNRLTLVGDPDRVERRAVDLGVGQRVRSDSPGHVPDLGGIVLDPARAREVLGELAVGAPADLAARIEHEAGRAGRALVDREDHLGRETIPSSVGRARYSRAKRPRSRGI